MSLPSYGIRLLVSAQAPSSFFQLVFWVSGQTKSFLGLTEFQLVPCYLQDCDLSLCSFLRRPSLENTPGHLVLVSDHPGHVASLLSSLLKHFHFLWPPLFLRAHFFTTLYHSCLPVSTALHPTAFMLRLWPHLLRLSSVGPLVFSCFF